MNLISVKVQNFNLGSIAGVTEDLIEIELVGVTSIENDKILVMPIKYIGELIEVLDLWRRNTTIERDV